MNKRIIKKCIKNGVWVDLGSGTFKTKSIVTDYKQIGIIFDRGIMWLDNQNFNKTWGVI